VLAEVTKVERVSVDRHFFEDLGADSMLMAQFCARVRKRPELPSVSMKDVYRHPTIRSLATALAGTTSNTVVSPAPASTEVATPVSTAQYVPCGALQLLFYLGYAYLAALIIIQGYVWVSASSGVIDGYARSALFGGALFLGMCVLPIVVKWTLIGRWKPRQIRIWSLAYVRFWIVKTLVPANPAAARTGPVDHHAGRGSRGERGRHEAEDRRRHRVLGPMPFVARPGATGTLAVAQDVGMPRAHPGGAGPPPTSHVPGSMDHHDGCATLATGLPCRWPLAGVLSSRPRIAV
jgi:hypothetical protein